MSNDGAAWREGGIPRWARLNATNAVRLMSTLYITVALQHVTKAVSRFVLRRLAFVCLVPNGGIVMFKEKDFMVEACKSCASSSTIAVTAVGFGEIHLVTSVKVWKLL
ncbi:hypothetical protein J6590_016987 [Homalodisca vitripennis]|nr:hypothetical protein J6590_016987 [Homalodisca vitripennis]